MSMVSMATRAYVTAARPDIEVKGGEAINVGDIRLELIWTPGHTAGHVVGLRTAT